MLLLTTPLYVMIFIQWIGVNHYDNNDSNDDDDDDYDGLESSIIQLLIL